MLLGEKSEKWGWWQPNSTVHSNTLSYLGQKNAPPTTTISTDYPPTPKHAHTCTYRPTPNTHTHVHKHTNKLRFDF